MNRQRSLAAAATLLAVAIVGGVTYAAIPGPDNVYRACMLKGLGTIRMIDNSLPATNLMSRCTAKEIEITWNQAGPQGATGPAGAQGEPGDDGTNGLNGPDGADGQDGVGVTTAAEMAGANCATGGIQVTAANGVSYVCNGDRGPQGDQGPSGPSAATELWGDSGGVTDWTGGGFVGFHEYGFESNNRYLVPFGATYGAFDCVQSVGHAGGTTTFWLRVNGLDVGNPCVMNGTATSASVADSYVVTPGDTISVRVLTTGTLASANRSLAWRLH